MNYDYEAWLDKLSNILRRAYAFSHFHIKVELHVSNFNLVLVGHIYHDFLYYMILNYSSHVKIARMQNYFNVVCLHIYSTLVVSKKHMNQNDFPISKRTSLHVLLCWFLICVFIIFKSVCTLVQKQQVQ